MEFWCISKQRGCKIKVLIIDDNETITSALSKFLGFRKHDCTVVNDGRNGLQLIQNQKFDVVLLDLALPNFTGIDIINELEKVGKVKDQKIIILTASNPSNEQINDLLKKGVHSFQTKPLSVNTLVEVMSS